MQSLESSKHRGLRKGLRIAGPVTLAVGALLTVIGFGSVFLATFTHSDIPVFFVCAFAGMPLLFLGTVMCMFGFMGALTRYVVAEQAPIAKDSINYMAEGTQDAVRTVARATARGVIEGVEVAESIRQPK